MMCTSTMMCQVRSFCGCLSLKIGCMITAGYTILFGLLTVAYFALSLTGGLSVSSVNATNIQNDLPVNHPSISKEHLLGFVEREEIIKEELRPIVVTILLALYAVWIVSGVFIFVALAKKQRGFLVPWIIVTAILIGLNKLAIVVIAKKGIDEDAVGQITILCILLAGKIYGMIVVKSHYRNRCQEIEEDTYKDHVVYKKVPDDEI